VQTQAVLTAIESVPASEVFRPPYAGSEYKPLFFSSQVCWNLLPQLPAPSSAPSAASILRHVERPWIDHMDSWVLQHSCATENMFCYGREIASNVAAVSQYVLLETEDQQELAIRFIQLGIDNFGVVRAGGSWSADGGHMNGRKWPVVFAGIMLNDSDMKHPGSFGGEDGQTYYGENGEALWGKICQYGYDYFLNGCSGSGSKDCRDPEGLVDGCNDYRVCCTSHTWVAQALAARILRAEDEWDHDAFFDYVDRWVDEGGNMGSSFIEDMWNTYRNNLPDVELSCSETPVRYYARFPSRSWSADAVLTIYNVEGKVIQTLRLRNDQLVRSIPPGAYFYSIRDGKYNSGRRIVQWE
jgi:hypothetical protein